MGPMLRKFLRTERSAQAVQRISVLQRALGVIKCFAREMRDGCVDLVSD